MPFIAASVRYLVAGLATCIRIVQWDKTQVTRCSGTTPGVKMENAVAVMASSRLTGTRLENWDLGRGRVSTVELV